MEKYIPNTNCKNSEISDAFKISAFKVRGAEGETTRLSTANHELLMVWTR
jgi:hypothetical protein